MDNVKVDYHNKRIEQLLNKYVTTEKYGKYKYFLDEIIQRRAFEFGFSEERMEEEIKCLVNNVEEICFDSEDDEITLDEHTVAAYSPNKKKIYINEKLFDDYYKYFKSVYPETVANYMIGEKLFSALNHEVYHAITRVNDKMVGIEHLDFWGIDMVEGTFLNEVLTESASTRTVRNKNSAHFKVGYRETLGYQNTTCMTGLLAHAIGVSERELLANGLGNYEEFKKFYREHAPIKNSRSSAENDIGMLDASATITNTYIVNEKPEKNARVFLKMYKTMLDLAGRHMAADTRTPDIQNIGEMFCRALKMNTIIISSLNYLEREGIITPEGKKEVLDDSDLARLVEDNRKRILGRFLIYKEELKPGTLEYNYAKRGSPLEVFKYFDDGELTERRMKKYREFSYDDLEQALRLEAQTQPRFFDYSLGIIKEDFQTTIPWENSIFQYGARILREQKLKQVQAAMVTQKADKLFSVNESTIPTVSASATLVGQKNTQRKKSLDDNDGEER